ncbi:MAG: hypothetical protein UY89_C0026G0002 [Parcubacteria group bacterium GW2011_GWA1_54_9]|nr:MAG: hypothetical protein UY89_C0026G0002 [Parcubacteria group bacterium GW2011_GWA1_54_9]KKW40652.1 MAG: hypothetical protein UY91_C0038G0007 [Parcubacteria group bacterium GW2011_GWB1_55_9]
MQKGQDIGQSVEIRQTQIKGKHPNNEDFVLEKSIFNNVFEKDIRKVFIYKKAERLAKAIHLITPAFAESMSLRNRIDSIAVGLVDAAILPSGAARLALSRELLALSSVLSIARTGGLLSPMNAELIAREAHILLQEVAMYEEPRLFLDDAPTLSAIAKNVISRGTLQDPVAATRRAVRNDSAERRKGHIPPKADAPQAQKDRKEAILSVIKDKGRANIKDISTLIRGISEKTIQRELLALIGAGIVLKQGERRWSTYSLV